jgi:Arc/MetJ family transcription regulator
MRTTLDLDDALFAALMERHPGATKTHAVEYAIREYLARDAVDRLRALRGALEIDDLSRELRRERGDAGPA